MITAWADKRVNLKQELKLLDFAGWEDANLAKVAELRRELDRLREESAADERRHEQRRQWTAQLGMKLVGYTADLLLPHAICATQDAILSGLWTLGLSLRTWEQLSAIVGRPVEELEATFVAADRRHLTRKADEAPRGPEKGSTPERAESPACPKSTEDAQKTQQEDCRAILALPLGSIQWGTRARRAFAHAGLKTIGDLVAYGPGNLLRFSGFGLTSYKGVRRRLQDAGLGPAHGLPGPVSRGLRAIAGH